MLLQKSVIFFAIALTSATSCSTRIKYEPTPIQPSTNALNVNTATVEQLEKLPGIGRKTAEAIVEYRNVNGPFRRVENLLLIKGVSENRFAELRPHIKTE